jgi:hypothetical protein
MSAGARDVPARSMPVCRGSQLLRQTSEREKQLESLRSYVSSSQFTTAMLLLRTGTVRGPGRRNTFDNLAVERQTSRPVCVGLKP